MKEQTKIKPNKPQKSKLKSEARKKVGGAYMKKGQRGTVNQSAGLWAFWWWMQCGNTHQKM